MRTLKLKIMGDIIEWNESIIEFQNAMKTIDENEELEIEVNSYGGDVYLGISISNAIKAHKGKTTCIITGIAASAASLIVSAADTVKMYSSSQIMVHNAWTIAMGNSKDLRKVADDLDKIGTSVLASYSHRVDEDKMKELLDAETYLTAEESINLGLADEIIDSKPQAVQSKVFSKLAEEFNNKLSIEKEQPKNKSSVNEDEFQQILHKIKADILNELQPKPIEPIQEPVKNSNLSKLFLNLK
ncbi:head maturation protease, ClpP-related [Oceanobacillus caeni]